MATKVLPVAWKASKWKAFPLHTFSTFFILMAFVWNLEKKKEASSLNYYHFNLDVAFNASHHRKRRKWKLFKVWSLVICVFAGALVHLILRNNHCSTHLTCAPVLVKAGLLHPCRKNKQTQTSHFRFDFLTDVLTFSSKRRRRRRGPTSIFRSAFGICRT